MVPAVAGQLVPLGHDAAHHGRVPLGDPTQGEERGMHLRPLELAEDAVDVGLDPAGETVPVRPRDAMRERLDLEIVLDVDGHRVAYHIA